MRNGFSRFISHFSASLIEAKGLHINKRKFAIPFDSIRFDAKLIYFNRRRETVEMEIAIAGLRMAKPRIIMNAVRQKIDAET